jgi:hypothetical protein
MARRMAHREAAASVQPPGSLHHLDPVVPGAAKRRGILPRGVLRPLIGVLGTAALPTGGVPFELAGPGDARIRVPCIHPRAAV